MKKKRLLIKIKNIISTLIFRIKKDLSKYYHNYRYEDEKCLVRLRLKGFLFFDAPGEVIISQKIRNYVAYYFFSPGCVKELLWIKQSNIKILGIVKNQDPE